MIDTVTRLLTHWCWSPSWFCQTRPQTWSHHPPSWSCHQTGSTRQYWTTGAAWNGTDHWNTAHKLPSWECWHCRIYLFIYWRPIARTLISSFAFAQSTAQRHLRAFTKSNLAEVENNTKHAHFTSVKHINIIRKLIPFDIALIKNGK